MKIKVGFIGAGKVGTALGFYFKKKKINVTGYYGHREYQTRQVAKKTKTQPFNTIEALIEENNLIWLTTNDDALPNVVKNIDAISSLFDKEKTFVHTSGVYSLSTLFALEKKGFSIATAHPLLAFNNTETSVQLLEQTLFGIEKEEKRLLSLFNQIENDYFFVSSNKKQLYHLASTVLSNYLVTLSHISNKIYKQAGMDTAIINRATKPLLQSVLNNLQQKKTTEALTGAIQREDVQTITQHIDSLKKELPDYLHFYKTMGLETAKMIEKDKLKSLFQ